MKDNVRELTLVTDSMLQVDMPTYRERRIPPEPQADMFTSTIYSRSQQHRTLHTIDTHQSAGIHIEEPTTDNSHMSSKHWNGVHFESQRAHNLTVIPCTNLLLVDEYPFNQLMSKNCTEAKETTTSSLNTQHMSAETSPFHQLVDTPTSSVDLTPDIAIITAGMEQVSPFSPFQELAVEDKNQSLCLESLQEDPHGLCDIRSNHLSKIGQVNSRSFGATGDQAIYQYVENDTNVEETLLTRNNNLIQQSVHSCSKSKTGKEKDQLTEQIGNPARESCYPCLNDSQDFIETFDIVSDLIDDMSDDTTAHTCGTLDASIEESVARMSSVSNTSEGLKQQVELDDTDNWFDNILMEVENWLQ